MHNTSIDQRTDLGFRATALKMINQLVSVEEGK